MKRYLLLTSVLALAACGGGSGGGGGSHSGAVLPSREAVDSTVLDSNKKVTSVASEVLIPKNSGDAVITRAASVNYGGKDYVSYRLDEVNFRVATGANDAFLRFKMDDLGKIDSLVMNVGSENQKLFRCDDVSADFHGIVYEYVLLDNNADANDSNDNIFDKDEEPIVRLVFSPENDPESFSTLSSAAAGKCPDGRVCRWDRIEQAFRVISSGSGVDGLTYSDFGKLQTANFGKYKGVTAENFANSKQVIRETDGQSIITDIAYSTWDDVNFDDDFNAFAGGYAINAALTPGETVDFSGKAIGRVYSSISTDGNSGVDREAYLDKYEIAYNQNDSDPDAPSNIPSINNAGHDLSKIFTTDNATLKIDENGLQTLEMHFDDAGFYRVTVTKDANGETNFDFEPTTETLASDGPVGYMFLREEDVNSRYEDGVPVGADPVVTANELDSGFYGVGEPTEAAGTFRYKEVTNFNAHDSREWEFQGAYGMTKDAPTNP